MIKWCLAIGLHAVWLFVFLYLWNHGGIGSVNYDSLSVSLSILQTALVIFGFIGFGYIAIMADRAARETARTTAQNLVKSELPAMLRRELADQSKTENVLGDEGVKEAQAAVNSLDGDKK